MNDRLIAEIVPLRGSRATDRPFDYLCDSTPDIRVGAIALIPFGSKTANCYGLVTSIRRSAPHMELKSVARILDGRFDVPVELIELCSYLRSRCFCTLSDAVRAVLPSGIRLRYDRANKEGTDGGFDYSVNEKTLVFYGIKDTSVLNDKEKGKYLDIIEFLETNGPSDLRTVMNTLNRSRSPLETLVKKGALEKTEQKVDRSVTSQSKSVEEITLNPEQLAAKNEITKALSENKARAFLLHGVTGSGKTKVLMSVMDDVLKENKSVIYLVPEISLTSQSFRLLSQRYGKDVCVIHSGLSEGERADAWFSVRSGEKKVVLGTRSAVFAPCKNLGCIIIDEEHDQSYKSDSSPRFHARDAARFRCAKNGALMILSSATPDVETYYKAEAGKYTLLKLPHRFSSSPLPKVMIEDLREDMRELPDRMIGSQLESQLRLNLANNEQSILFVDRRGYNKFVSCLDCGHVPLCPNCSVSLTLHSNRKLVCHYCGHSEILTDKCPACGKDKLIYHGYGSQKVEDELNKLFPDARILRMDADTVTQKNSHDKILTAFKDHKADILLGTQMVAKGHDFPLVTLVGVVMADTSLYMSDYRAYEHSFALLTQVIGRAGRGRLPGRAVIQTLNPYHEILDLCRRQDYEGFYSREIELRRALVFPPFCSICVFGFASDNEKSLSEAVIDFNAGLRSELDASDDLKFIVYGPFDAPIYKLNNVYRKRYVIKYKPSGKASELFFRLLNSYSSKYHDKVKVYADINPSLI